MMVTFRLFQYTLLAIVSCIIGMVLILIIGIIWLLIKGHRGGREVIGRHERSMDSRHG